jgi:hypothetical protein
MSDEDGSERNLSTSELLNKAGVVASALASSRHEICPSLVVWICALKMTVKMEIERQVFLFPEDREALWAQADALEQLVGRVEMSLLATGEGGPGGGGIEFAGAFEIGSTKRGGGPS